MMSADRQIAKDMHEQVGAMSNIRSYAKETRTAAGIIDYRSILQEYIDKVLQIIGENDIGITWYICDETDFSVNYKWLSHVAIPLNCQSSRKYGRCSIKTKEVWISTAAIRTVQGITVGLMNKKMPQLLLEKSLKISGLQERNMDIPELVWVILDEFTHIKTGADHGTPKYDEKLKAYRNQLRESWGNSLGGV